MDIESVHNRMKSSDVETRVEVLQELATTDDSTTVLPFIYGALEDRNLKVRNAANAALIEVKEGIGILAAIDRAIASSKKERVNALRLLRDHPDRRAYDRLNTIANDTEEDVDLRALAIAGLVGIEHPDTVDVFLDLLEDDDSKVRAAAIEGLTDMPFEVEPDAYGRVETIRRIAKFMKGDTDKAKVHAQAALALGTCNFPSSLNYLAEAIEDDRAAVRKAALTAVKDFKAAKKHTGVCDAIRRRLASEKSRTVKPVLKRVAEELEIE